MIMQPKIVILYLCYQNLRHLPEVVASWEKLTYPRERMTIVILPAGSPDGIIEAIEHDVLPRSGKDLPEIVMINEPNKGFAANNNVGIRWALERDFDYVFLQNGDLKIEPGIFEKLAMVMEADKTIGSAQPLVCFWHEPTRVNVAGGVFHVAGYGYARDNGRLLAEVSYAPKEEITYASGAALFVRAQTYRDVGLLEEGFFMYHDDLEFGLRLRLHGLKNVLVSNARAFHDYQFSRNPKKFAWTEFYRWAVLLAYLRWRTLFLLGPLLDTIEFGTWLMALKGGWLGAKFWALRQWFRPQTWQFIWRMRSRAQRLRRVSDRVFMRDWTGRIEAQEQSSFFIERIVNPIVDTLWRVMRKLIVW